MTFLKIIIPVLVASVATGFFVNRALTKTRTVTISQASGSLETKIIALQGRIYPQGENRFILLDDTGQAELETCPLWHRRIVISEGEEAIVTGERLPDRPTLEGSAFVMSTFTIEGSRSGTIVIREQLGKPPWALSANPTTQPTYPQRLVED